MLVNITMKLLLCPDDDDDDCRDARDYNFYECHLVFTDGCYNTHDFENIFTIERTIAVVNNDYGDCNYETVFRIIIRKIIVITLITVTVTINKFLKS